MTSATPIRILAVDAHPLLLEGVATVVRDHPDMVLVGQASTCQEAIQQYRQLKPDVTLMDLGVPEMGGIEAMTAIQRQFPRARIIMMATFEGDVPVRRALQAGAASYILKSMSNQEIVDAIRQVHSGRRRVPMQIATKIAEYLDEEQLSDRELDILRHTAGGNRNRDIGRKLFISEETVKVHLRHIMEKLGARDRTQAVTIAARRGFIQL